MQAADRAGCFVTGSARSERRPRCDRPLHSACLPPLGAEERERRLLEVVRRSGMRMIGPNCMGVINTDPAVRLHATFARRTAEHGVISFMSQSGALGEGVLEHVEAHKIGLSKFVSLGNRADVSPNDLLEEWGDDPLTKVILIYVEVFGNPRNFIRIAREVARRKPVLVVKSGRASAGARAARSHTGSLADSEAAVHAMLRCRGSLFQDIPKDHHQARSDAYSTIYGFSGTRGYSAVG